ncbi:hypothetical protein B7463_g430, partial [Scytalidium lignicola]
MVRQQAKRDHYCSYQAWGEDQARLSTTVISLTLVMMMVILVAPAATATAATQILPLIIDTVAAVPPVQTQPNSSTARSPSTS